MAETTSAAATSAAATSAAATAAAAASSPLAPPTDHSSLRSKLTLPTCLTDAVNYLAEATKLSKKEAPDEEGISREEPSQVRGGPLEDNPDYSVIGKLGPPLLDNQFAPIVGAKGIGSALRIALKSQLLVRNTEWSTFGSNAEKLTSKLFEGIGHIAAETISGISTTPLLLAAAGLNSLVGSFDDVKATYDRCLEQFGNKTTGKFAARMVQGLHFVAWVMKNIAVLSAAGLISVINSAIFLAQKITTGLVALSVHGLFAATHNWKKITAALTGVGLLAGLAFAAKAIAGVAGGIAVGAGVVSALPYIGMALAAILSVYLIVRCVRGIYEHRGTTQSLLFKHDQRRFLNQDLPLNTRLARLENPEQTPEEKNKFVNEKILENFNTPEAISHLYPEANRVAARVVGTTGHIRALGRDVMRTFSSWEQGRHDISTVDRRLALMSDEALNEAVFNYKVDSKITSEEDIEMIKQGLLTALRAQQKIARHNYAQTTAFTSELDKLKDLNNGVKVTLDDAQMEEAYATAMLLKGSDKDILGAIKQYCIADRSPLFVEFLSRSYNACNYQRVKQQIESDQTAEKTQALNRGLHEAVFAKTSFFHNFLKSKGYTVSYQANLCLISTKDGQTLNLRADETSPTIDDSSINNEVKAHYQQWKNLSHIRRLAYAKAPAATVAPQDTPTTGPAAPSSEERTGSPNPEDKDDKY